MRVYLDTSAAVKLLRVEAESAAMRVFAGRSDVELVGTFLLETELRRFAGRQPISQTDVTQVLDGISLFSLEDSDFAAAGLLPGFMRSLDALHVQGALALGADQVATYDAQMVTACGLVGLRVVSPK